MPEAFLSVAELVAQIRQLVEKCAVIYPTGKGKVIVDSIGGPEGPIYIKRQSTNSAKSWNLIKAESISSQMLQRYVNAVNTKLPVNIDRVLGASYNTRSALEALVAACPNFFICRPQRITAISSSKVTIEPGHKHLIWKPGEQPHALGQVVEVAFNGYVTETPSRDMFFDAIPSEISDSAPKAVPLDEGVRRLHSQMQVYLCKVGHNLGLRSWVAIQDHGIQTKSGPLIGFDYVVKDLKTERAINNYPTAIKVARDIDCIWFNGGMPFAFEVEHTTGVTSGLDRMNTLNQRSPNRTDYVIVAPDDDRSMVIEKSNSNRYRGMGLWYLSYSSLMEMNDFTSRHPYLCGDQERTNFIKMFMEKIGVS